MGYEKFAAHGGDTGSDITEKIALYHSESLIGIHITDVPWEHELAEIKDSSKAEKKFKRGFNQIVDARRSLFYAAKY